jgi:thioredoxin 2
MLDQMPVGEADLIEYPCASCGATNRIPRTRVKDDPKCGRCKQSVFPDHPVAATDATWKREVEDSPIPVLVDFWAEWCGPCRAVAPVLEQLARERKGRLKVVKLNVDQNPRTAAAHRVQSIPMLQLQRGPLFLDKQVGALSKPMLEAWLDRYL